MALPVMLQRGSASLLPYMMSMVSAQKQEVWNYNGAIKELPEVLKKKGLKKPLVVTEKILLEVGVPKNFLEGCKASKIGVAIYDGVIPEPTVECVVDGVNKYLTENCDCLVAIGGGSSIDCAKGICAGAANPQKALEVMFGPFKVTGTVPELIAAPTTSGTSSEGSIGCVLSHNGTKKLMISPKIKPSGVIVDGELTLTLPKKPTAESGMDALTHALEGIISRNRNHTMKMSAMKPIKTILDNLENACGSGAQDVNVRIDLARAVYQIGPLLNTLLVGYVHGFGHKIGSDFKYSHGYSMGVFLPHVLEFHRNDKSAIKYLSIAAVECGLGTDDQPRKELSDIFINRVKALAKNIGIPEHLPELNPSKYDEILDAVFEEVDTTYRPPRYMSRNEGKAFLKKVRGQ